MSYSSGSMRGEVRSWASSGWRDKQVGVLLGAWAFFILVAFADWGWYTGELAEWETVGVLLITVLAIGWYSYETRWLRQETTRLREETRRARQAQASADLLHEWNRELWDARGQCEENLPTLRDLAARTPPPLTKLRTSHPYAIQLAHFFDKAGFLAENEYVDWGLINVAFGSSARFWWEVLERFISAEDAKKQDPKRKYLLHFRKLAASAAENTSAAC